jgi:transcriptional regulator with XRE-family HTH domain
MSTATIGSALVAKRHELGLEKGQAADKIGMSRTTYSSYEQDAQRPSVDVFPALAGFLDVSMEELLTLYGATCVAAVRPSLEKVLADHESAVKEATDGGMPQSSMENPAATFGDLSAEVHSNESLDAPDPIEPEQQSTASDQNSRDHESAELLVMEDATAPEEALALADAYSQQTSESDRS